MGTDGFGQRARGEGRGEVKRCGMNHDKGRKSALRYTTAYCSIDMKPWYVTINRRRVDNIHHHHPKKQNQSMHFTSTVYKTINHLSNLNLSPP